MKYTYLLPIILLAAISFASNSVSTNGGVNLLQCLNSNSDPSQPISQALYFPTNSSYSDVLQSYIRNLLFSGPTTPKPQFIVAAAHVSHIQASIICAKSHGLEMRIRSGGHDFEGFSYVSGKPFFILDMFNLRAIHVSIEEETAWVETGATLGELYYRISEKSSTHAFPGGTCPSVGVGGHITAGGFGNMVRKYGLASDNVVDATLVDASGRLLDRKSMGEDLFWAVTGGGAASFGVVLAYKIRLVRVPATVSFAVIQITDGQHGNSNSNSNSNNFTDTVYKYLQIADKLNDEIFIKLAFNVVKVGRTKAVNGTFLILFLGNSESLVDLMNEKLPELGLTKPNCADVSWVESMVRWTAFPAGTPTSILLSRIHPGQARLKRKSDFLKNPISKKGLEIIFNKMKEPETPVLKFFPFGGIMNKVSSSAKPFPHRAGNIALIEIATNWNQTEGAQDDDYYMNITRKFYECITPFVSKSREAYLGYRDIDLGINNHGPNSYYEAAATYGFKYYKNNFHRLVQIKSKADPDDFFRYEQSIPIFPNIATA
ncbi:hypothetical protein ABFS82_03G023000 [Erythranthe guttata]|uniref:FAD-binding PCMH-type domain-containing protein n=1 Tax=Erythranthe guttata TaxID=4155 RepID=A0A022QQR0_ERYGU|nr:PREDICTED: reticuline oxidase-like protein [Erythranthe guttata]EYU29613.1 hypothetical protein MIMGU_mgv1a004108mg [Erythranthe guttata]|eukprot:XP_012846696.1 PREDICTED: reticuline oxidase-like protein [Erythranthe guttata]